MPRPRLLLSDFTGGEISKRVQARADLERYSRSLSLCENFVVAQQGGIMLRRGSEYVGASIANQQTPAPLVSFITWRGSFDDQPDILFELSGNTLRGWTRDGPILVGGVPLSISIPLPSYASPRLQFAQSGNLLAMVNGVDAPLLVTVNSTTSWSVAAVPSTGFPSRTFLDTISPPKQDSVFDFTFNGFASGNTYNIYVGGQAIKSFERIPNRKFGVREVAKPFTYSTTTALNVTRITAGIRESKLVTNKDDIVVVFVAGTTYRVTMNGASAGIEVNLVAQAESATINITSATNAIGRLGDEKAWSYPFTVQHLGSYYLCLQPHISSGATTPGGAPLFWQLLAGPPYYESIQPSPVWLIGSTSYSIGNRGFPSCVEFHEQRLILAGTRQCPKTLWGSALLAPLNFILGPEDDEALSVDLDAKESPSIRWLVSNNGLVVGTSAGIWVMTSEAALSPSDIAAIRYSGDRVERYQAILAGNETVFIAQGRRQMRTLRWNEGSGPYETLEVSVLAEHLARYGLDQLIYAHQPQPVIYVRTSQPGLVVAVTYNRQGDLLAFHRLQFNAEILSIGILFDPDDGDVLWMVMKRNDKITIEKMQYPITDAPVDVPDTNATRHLDGWVTRTHSLGVISGLQHLIGRSVTVLDSAGAVVATQTVVDSGSAPPVTPVAFSEPGFELVGTWIYSGSTRLAAAARSGGNGLRLSSINLNPSSVITQNIPVTPGRIYKAECWARWNALQSGYLANPLIVYVYSALPDVILVVSNDYTPGLVGVWQYLSVTFTAPAGAANVRLQSLLYGVGAVASVIDVDDFGLYVGDPGDGQITFTGTNVIVGEAFTGTAVTVEPEGGNPAGSSMGNAKRWSNVEARLHQSALPKINGERPSDYDQADPRATPGRLRSGDFKVNTDGWADGALTIVQDLPHATQVVGLFGDLGVGTGG